MNRKRKEEDSMNKKTKVALVVIGLLAVIFVISNAITYALADKNVIEYFISEDEEKLSGIWDELKRDGRQSVTIDDYTITLEAYLFEDKTNDGYACFSVEREGYDMREEIAGETVLYEVNSTFGEDERFTFEMNGSGFYESSYKKKEDVMYVYFKFEIDEYKFDKKYYYVIIKHKAITGDNQIKQYMNLS